MFIVGILIPYYSILLYLIPVKYYPLLGILSPSRYLIFQFVSYLSCVVWFDSYWYHTSCVDVFMLIQFLPQSCVIWILIKFGQPFGVTLWCALFLVYLVFCPNCISFGSCKSMHAYLLVYLFYGMLVFLDPIYRGYSTKS